MSKVSPKRPLDTLGTSGDGGQPKRLSDGQSTSNSLNPGTVAGPSTSTSPQKPNQKDPKKEEEENPYGFYLRQLEKMHHYKEIDEIGVAINATAFIPHVFVSIKIDGVSETLNYIKSPLGCRVGNPDKMSSWRSVANTFSYLAEREIGEFLFQCCNRGVAIRSLRFSADNHDPGSNKAFFDGISTASFKAGMMVKELTIEQEIFDLNTAYAIVRVFRAEVVTMKVPEITNSVAQSFENTILQRGFSENTHRFVLTSPKEIPEDVRGLMVERSVHRRFHRLIELHEVSFDRRDFWHHQGLQLDNHDAVDELRISVNTKDFLPNVCVFLKISRFSDQLHYMRSDIGCRVGVPAEMHKWRSSEMTWLQKAHEDVKLFLESTTVRYDQKDRPITILTLITDSRKPPAELRDEEDFRRRDDDEAVKNFLEGVCKVAVQRKVMITVLNITYPEGTIEEAGRVLEGIQFKTCNIHVSRFRTRNELEKLPVTLSDDESCTISFKKGLPSNHKKAVKRKAFSKFNAKIDSANDAIVLTKKTRQISPKVHEVVDSD